MSNFVVIRSREELKKPPFENKEVKYNRGYYNVEHYSMWLEALNT